MPGMKGAQFLEKARILALEAIRFLLTGYSDVKDILDAVNKGEIHRYLTKPWNDDDLLLQVRSALEEANDSLERGFVETIRLLSSLVETLNPRLGSYLSFVAQLAKRMGQGFGLDKLEQDQIEIAGLLHDIGLFQFPYGSSSLE